ncbi:anthranilate synthase component I family protein [Agromyces sp. SYSU T00194]|uniref:anthranilate synthase component I family protein n=1 Tax=Agromyces chitinivorans TaxID=3158560 RepID=UPI00339744D3
MPRLIRSTTLPAWRDPEAVFLALAGAGADVAWLDGGRDATEGRSVIAVAADGAPTVTAGSDADPEAVLDALAARVGGASRADGERRPEGAAVGWHGWFGYEFGARMLGLPSATATTPDAAFFLADRVVVFDHAVRAVRLEWLEDDAAPAEPLRAWVDRVAALVAGLPETDAPRHPLPVDAGSRPVGVRWRHAPDAYARMIEDCRAAITRGDAYQLCLTNRIDVDAAVDPVAAYLRLRRSSPSHHGGFVRIGDTALLSASPEQFLHVGTDRIVSTKPMKGTRRRSADPAEDAALRAELLASDKERAENLMIVDLMRNDLARIAEVGEVWVTGLLVVEEYPHVHQLVSTVTARLRHPLTALDVVRATFPAGSMTGAPKESAMRILHGLERGPRGVYSGAFGRIGVDGGADLAMVIRSIVVTPEGASIGTGGGITALSDPAEEVEETRLKARALLAVLGVDGDDDGGRGRSARIE